MDAGAARDALGATVTLDVWRLPATAVPRAAAATMTTGRRLPRRAPVRFARLLGTGDDSFLPRGAELRRWAQVTVWRSPGDVVALRPPWAAHARSWWRARLAPVAARGSWGGAQPFAVPDRDAARRWDGPVLAITHATLRPRGALRFYRAVPPVVASMAGHPGLCAAFGVGESPLGVQGTVSLWDDTAAVRAFAWRDPAHRAVVDRTPGEKWYAEDIFARFAVLATEGDVATLTRPGGRR